MGKTPRNKATPQQPNLVTPAKSDNPYAVLDDSETDSDAEHTEEAYLPNTSKIIDDLSLVIQQSEGSDQSTKSNDSDSNSNSSASSSMGSSTTSDKSKDITKDELQELMEELEPGCTTPKAMYTYTDIVNFQTTMGNALVKVPAPFQSYGYSYLADTTENYISRSGEHPPPMPTMPTAPEDMGRREIRKASRDLKHYKSCLNIKAIGIRIMEHTFPECLRIIKTDLGLPREITLKVAFSHVLDSVLSESEKLKEFIRYTDELTNLKYSHEPGTPSLPVYLGELERIRKYQHIVAPSPNAGTSYDNLIVRAHMQIHEGTGGRRDMIQELQIKWKQKALDNPTWTEKQRWQNFKIFYCKKIKALDLDGLTTAKTRSRANAVVNLQQQALNEHTAAQLDGLQEQLDNMTIAMSVHTQGQPGNGVPPIIQTHGSNTSALGTTDQSFRTLIEERNKHDRERAAFQARIKELERSIATQTTHTMSTNTCSPDQRIMQRDAQGNKWFKVAFYCSKHGYNTSHRNCNCRDKHKDHGHPWTEGATHEDHRGGSNQHAEHYLHWYNPRSKEFAPAVS